MGDFRFNNLFPAENYAREERKVELYIRLFFSSLNPRTPLPRVIEEQRRENKRIRK